MVDGRVALRSHASVLNHTDEETLPKLPVQYADFALWQRRWLKEDAIERQLGYWKRHLADAPTALDLPFDYSRPSVRRSNGGRVSAILSPETARALVRLGQKENATLFMTLLACFQTLLFRYSGQEDIVVGSPVAGRTMVVTENLIGAFVNTPVPRADLSGNPTSQAAGRVRNTVLARFVIRTCR
jgi:pristinamycin I synthase-3/4